MRYILGLFVSFFCLCSAAQAQLTRSDVSAITDMEYEILQSRDLKRAFDFYNLVLDGELKVAIRDIHILPDTYNRTDNISFSKKSYIEYQTNFFKEYTLKSHEIKIKRISNVGASKRALVEYVLKSKFYKKLPAEKGGFLQERHIKATCRDVYLVEGLSALLSRRDCTHRNDYLTGVED